jgi:hypothetical protein
MVGVVCGSLVDIESPVLRSAEGASRRMVQAPRNRGTSFRRPLERPSRPLRGASATRVGPSVEMFHVKQADARDEI